MNIIEDKNKKNKNSFFYIKDSIKNYWRNGKIKKGVLYSTLSVLVVFLFVSTNNNKEDNLIDEQSSSESEVVRTMTHEDKDNNLIFTKNENEEEEQNIEFAPDEFIVKFKSQVEDKLKKDDIIGASDIGINSVNALNNKHGVLKTEKVFKTKDKKNESELSLFRKVKFSEEKDIKKIVKEYKDDPNIEYAEPNYKMEKQTVPSDPYFSSSGSWGQPYDDLWGLKKIEASDAWDTTTGSSDITVAIIDTGVDYNHEDLSSNMWTNSGEIPDNGIDDDSNGYIDDIYGWDFYNDDNDPIDDHGHGTHCSGTVSGVGDNSIGVVGVNWNAKIMAVKFLGSTGSGWSSDAALAIEYAADSGADILSNSWGGGGQSQVVTDAIAYAHDQKGCVVVAAAGNSNADANNYWPAGDHNVITVASSTENDEKSSFSNWGSKIDVAAPGGGNSDGSSGRIYQNILSLRASGTDMYGDGNNIVDDDYYRARGTSMACPHVAGLAALILANNPTWTNEQIRQVICSSSDDIGDAGKDDYFGYGRINANNALQVDTPPSIARLSGPSGTLYNNVDITGSAFGENFVSYKLEYGIGSLPASWTEITTSSDQVTNGTLYSNFDTTLVSDGDITFKLTVSDSEITIYDTLKSTIDNIYFTAPEEETVKKAGDSVEIKGRALGTNFVNYQIEYGQGKNPSSWSTEGITLENGGNQPVDENTLGIWDASSINQADFYKIKLKVIFSDRQQEENVIVYLDPTIHSGWPQEVTPWQSGFLRLALMDVPTTADLDGNGTKEILIGYGNYMYIFNADGTSYPGWPKLLQLNENTLITQKSPTVADIDNDGYSEIALGVGSYLYVWNHDGTDFENWPKFIGSYTRTAFDDINNDGNYEIIITTSWSKFGILDIEGNWLSSWPINYYAYQSFPAIGDIDNDGTKEFVFSAYDSNDEVTYLYAYNIDGSIVDGWPVQTGDYICYSYPALGDLDKDGDLEVVIGSDQDKVYAFHHDGSLVSGWPQDTTGEVDSSPALGDLNNDGYLEIVVGCDRAGFNFEDRKLYAFNYNGSLLSGWPISANYSNHSFYGYGSPSLADIDGDEQLEILVDNDTDYFNAYESDGSIVSGFPKYSGEIGAFTTNAPAVDDIDGDGLMEVVFVNYDCKVFVWDLEGAKNTIQDWSHYRHDQYHTGLYSIPLNGFLSDNKSTVSVNNNSPKIGNSVDITVTLKDRYNSPLSGKEVEISATGSGNTITQPVSLTDSNGQATAVISSTNSGTKTITAKDKTDNIILSSTVDVTFSEDGVSPTISTVVVSPSSLTVGNTSNIIITLKNYSNNPISGKDVIISATGSNNTITQPSVSTDSEGQVTGTISSTKAETKTITVTDTTDSIELSSHPTIVFNPGLTSQSISTATASPSNLQIGEESTITVNLKDIYSNPISGHTVTLSSNRGGDVITQPSSPTDSNGQTQGSISSAIPGTSTITVYDSTQGLSLNIQPQVTFALQVHAPKITETKNEQEDYNFYSYNSPEGTQACDVQDSDMWNIPDGNNVIAQAFLDGDKIGVIKNEQGDYNFYLYNAPQGQEAATQIGADYWNIPGGNNIVSIAGLDSDGDSQDELAVLKNENGDHNLYIYELPSGDEAKSKIASDLWNIPFGNNVISICGINIQDSGSDKIAVLKNESGDHNLYIYDAPTSDQACTKIVSDLWNIPDGNNVISIAGIDYSGNGRKDKIAVLKNENGDYDLYVYNLPSTLLTPASSYGQDLWNIPGDNNIVDLGG